MADRFNVGDKVFITTGIDVLEGTVERRQSGRFVVSYKGYSCEPLGRICVSGNRLYRTYDDAVARIKRSPAVIVSKEMPVQRHTMPHHADEPGDGWARR